MFGSEFWAMTESQRQLKLGQMRQAWGSPSVSAAMGGSGSPSVSAEKSNARVDAVQVVIDCARSQKAKEQREVSVC